MTTMPLLGMGTWGMGGKFERDDSNVDESIAMVRYALGAGIKLIDVAEIYGEGLTEEIVGRAIEDHDRSEFFLVSKVWKTHLSYDDVLKACEQSLERLQTSYLDAYLVHWPSESSVPLSETMSAMEHLVEQGLVKRIGVSNFSVPLLKAAAAELKHNQLFTNQIEYNLYQQDAAADIIPYCMTQNIEVMAYRPLAKGMIAGMHAESMDRLTKKYSKSPVQIALNWIMSQGIRAIPKCGTREHLDEVMGATDWRMTPDDIATLSSVQ